MIIQALNEKGHSVGLTGGGDSAKIARSLSPTNSSDIEQNDGQRLPSVTDGTMYLGTPPPDHQAVQGGGVHPSIIPPNISQVGGNIGLNFIPNPNPKSTNNAPGDGTKYYDYTTDTFQDVGGSSIYNGISGQMHALEGTSTFHKGEIGDLGSAFDNRVTEGVPIVGPDAEAPGPNIWATEAQRTEHYSTWPQLTPKNKQSVPDSDKTKDTDTKGYCVHCNVLCTKHHKLPYCTRPGANPKWKAGSDKTQEAGDQSKQTGTTPSNQTPASTSASGPNKGSTEGKGK